MLGLGGPLTASMVFLDAFSVLFHVGTSLSFVKAFLTGCRGLVLTSYRVWRGNRFEGPLRALQGHVWWKACGRNAVETFPLMNAGMEKKTTITARVL